MEQSRFSRTVLGYKLQVWNVGVTNSRFYSSQNMTRFIRQKPTNSSWETPSLSPCICLLVRTQKGPRIIFNVWLFTSDRAGLVLLLVFVAHIYMYTWYLFLPPPPTSLPPPLTPSGHCCPMNYNKVLLYCNAAQYSGGKWELEKQRDMAAGSRAPRGPTLDRNK